MDQDLDRGERLPGGLHPRRDRVGGDELLDAVGQRIDGPERLGGDAEGLVGVDGVVERVRRPGQSRGILGQGGAVGIAGHVGLDRGRQVIGPGDQGVRQPLRLGDPGRGRPVAVEARRGGVHAQRLADLLGELVDMRRRPGSPRGDESPAGRAAPAGAARCRRSRRTPGAVVAGSGLPWTVSWNSSTAWASSCVSWTGRRPGSAPGPRRCPRPGGPPARPSGRQVVHVGGGEGLAGRDFVTGQAQGRRQGGTQSHRLGLPVGGRSVRRADTPRVESVAAHAEMPLAASESSRRSRGGKLTGVGSGAGHGLTGTVLLLGADEFGIDFSEHGKHANTIGPHGRSRGHSPPRRRRRGEGGPPGGGNAVDAAVAAMLACCVAMPGSVGLGGYGGSLVAYLAGEGRRSRSISTRGRRWRTGPSLRWGPERHRGVTRRVTVPAVVAGLDLALERFGTLSWAVASAPAIALAEGGVGVTAELNVS